MRPRALHIACSLLFFCGDPLLRAQTSATSDLEQIRQEMNQLKQEYEQMTRAYETRFSQLDDRLKQLEATSSLPARIAAPALPDSSAASARPAIAPAPVVGQTASAPASQVQKQRQFVEPTDSIQLSMDEQERIRVRERMESILRDYVDITGYFRAGYGRDNQGGPQVAFQAPGALAKGRLGNEAENYGELAISKNFYLPGAFALNRIGSSNATPSVPEASFTVRISMYNPYQNYLDSTATGFGLAEAWGAIGNVSESQPNMNFWAGNRYYRRHDIHIDDFFLYNMSGGGGGVEDIQTPIGKVALAWIGIGSQSGFSDLPQPDPQNKAGFSKSNLDFRLYDFNLIGGTGELGVDFSKSTSGKDALGNTAPNANGGSITFIHTAEKWLGEDNLNKIYIQYGYGPAKTFTSGFETYTVNGATYIRPDAPGSYRFRVAENMIFESGQHFTMSPVLLYQLTDYKRYGGLQNWFSAGIRPQAQFNNYFSLAFEPFYDYVDDHSTNIADSLFKFTIAPQVTLGRHFMSRPAIRAFATWAHWGNGFVGKIGGPDYATSNNGWTWGVQTETWW